MSVDIEGRYLDINGIRTWYRDAGQGPVIVLIHGAALAVDSRSTWFRTAPALERNFRVIMFDQIGFGRTDMAADRRYVDRVNRVEHAVAFLKALGISGACLVGHSEGGFIATRIAMEQPSIARDLVIVTSGSTAPYLGDHRDATWIAANKELYDDPRQFESEDGAILVNSVLNYTPDPEHEMILRENFRRAVARGQIQIRSDQDDPPPVTDYKEREKVRRQYIAPYISSLDLPVLLVWAADDQTVGADRGVKLLNELKRADLHVFSRSAHNVMHDRSNDFNKLLQLWCNSH